MCEIIIKPGTGHVQRSSLNTALSLSEFVNIKVWKWSSIGKATGVPQTIAGSGYDDLYQYSLQKYVNNILSDHDS